MGRSPEEGLSCRLEEASKSMILQVLCPDLGDLLMNFRLSVAALEDLQFGSLCLQQERQPVWNISSRPGWA